MNTIATTCLRILAFVQLFVVCFCMTMLGYTHHATDYAMPGGGLRYLPAVPRERCFAKCPTIPECYFVSYDTASGDCKLSSLDDSVTGKIPAEGWSLFRLKPPCEFLSIGSHDLAICNHLVVKAAADNACASFGSWRLLEPRTLEMYWEIVDYLLAMPVAMGDVYGSVWVGVEYDNGWYFPDASPLQLDANNTDDVDGTRRCMRLRESKSYKYADQPCDEEYNYICEKI